MGIHGSVDSGSGFGWFGKAALTALGTPPLAGILFYFVFVFFLICFWFVFILFGWIYLFVFILFYLPYFSKE